MNTRFSAKKKTLFTRQYFPEMVIFTFGQLFLGHNTGGGGAVPKPF
jgi:hypothetical protein